MKLPALTDRWLVGFVPAANRGVARLASGVYGHCMAFGWRPQGHWLLVETNVWGLDVQLVDTSFADKLMGFCIRNGRLLNVPPRRRTARFTPPPLLTCSTTIAALVGVPGWYFTPRQLYRALQKAGAEVLTSPEDLP